jgi:hypothetical protein
MECIKQISFSAQCNNSGYTLATFRDTYNKTRSKWVFGSVYTVLNIQQSNIKQTKNHRMVTDTFHLIMFTWFPSAASIMMMTYDERWVFQTDLGLHGEDSNQPV